MTARVDTTTAAISNMADMPLEWPEEIDWIFKGSKQFAVKLDQFHLELVSSLSQASPKFLDTRVLECSNQPLRFWLSELVLDLEYSNIRNPPSGMSSQT